MNKTRTEQQNESGEGNTWVHILLMVIMVVIISGIGISRENKRESQVGTVSYVTQLEWLAGSKGYTTEDKVTYKERQQLETEEGRYEEVMKYLEDTEVSESEFKDIKEIQSNYQQSVQQVNESGRKDNSLLIAIVFAILTFFVLSILFTFALTE